MSLMAKLPEPVKRLLRPVRHLPDRVLHRSRRRRVLAHLARGGGVKQAVFICLGNINRSAYAAALFESQIPADRRSGVVVRSAGFIGPDRSASTTAQALARRRGLDLTDHRSRVVDAGELAATDLIVVMDTQQRADICRLTGRPPQDVVVLGDCDPEPIAQRTVLDPYGHPEEVFESVFDRIDRCVASISSTVWRT